MRLSSFWRVYNIFNGYRNLIVRLNSDGCSTTKYYNILDIRYLVSHTLTLIIFITQQNSNPKPCNNTLQGSLELIKLCNQRGLTILHQSYIQRVARSVRVFARPPLITVPRLPHLPPPNRPLRKLPLSSQLRDTVSVGRRRRTRSRRARRAAAFSDTISPSKNVRQTW